MCVPLICVEDPCEQGHNFICLQVFSCQFCDSSGHSIVVETEEPGMNEQTHTHTCETTLTWMCVFNSILYQSVPSIDRKCCLFVRVTCWKCCSVGGSTAPWGSWPQSGHPEHISWLFLEDGPATSCQPLLLQPGFPLCECWLFPPTPATQTEWVTLSSDSNRHTVSTDANTGGRCSKKKKKCKKKCKILGIILKNRFQIILSSSYFFYLIIFQVTVLCTA